MNGAQKKRLLVQIASKHLGDWGEQFIIHQCHRINADPNNLSREDIKKLAEEASKSAVIVIGKNRAIKLRSDILKLSEHVD